MVRRHDGEIRILAAGHGAGGHAAHVVIGGRTVIAIHWGGLLGWSSGQLVMMMLRDWAVVAGTATHDAGQ